MSKLRFRRTTTNENKKTKIRGARIFKRAFESRITTGLLALSAAAILTSAFYNQATTPKSSAKIECEGRAPAIINIQNLEKIDVDPKRCTAKVCTKETENAKEKCEPATTGAIEKGKEIETNYQKTIAENVKKSVIAVFAILFGMLSWVSRRRTQIKEKIKERTKEPRPPGGSYC